MRRWGGLRSLENWQSETASEENLERQIAAGDSGVVKGIVAMVEEVIE